MQLRLGRGRVGRLGGPPWAQDGDVLSTIRAPPLAPSYYVSRETRERDVLNRPTVSRDPGPEKVNGLAAAVHRYSPSELELMGPPAVSVRAGMGGPFAIHGTPLRVKSVWPSVETRYRRMNQNCHLRQGVGVSSDWHGGWPR